MYRHIENEPELVHRLSRGLEAMPGFQDSDDDDWAQDLPVIRFATIDPTVHSLETQIRFMGHASVVVGSHGGAMGLVLFMPPGHGAVIELQVPEVDVNRHFDIMSTQLGLQYQQVKTERVVNVEDVWQVVHRHVVGMLSRME
jgi:capsular polysaccharide biosynthesis protein